MNLAGQVHDGTGGVPSAAEQVGNRDRIGVEELAQDHARLPLSPVSGHKPELSPPILAA